ncbi:unnamed protein product [Timema podura]|uniref:Uncharacterized protein n=1 Tax=Timema podura TaxID=61482 RepID=A0ABN7NJF3_TIMPD|nr:unnamed protein product [Timema podura]
MGTLIANGGSHLVGWTAVDEEIRTRIPVNCTEGVAPLKKRSKYELEDQYLRYCQENKQLKGHRNLRELKVTTYTDLGGVGRGLGEKTS